MVCRKGAAPAARLIEVRQQTLMVSCGMQARRHGDIICIHQLTRDVSHYRDVGCVKAAVRKHAKRAAALASNHAELEMTKHGVHAMAR